MRIAKHGNRSFTSLCGSADVLEALGVSIEVPVAMMERALRDAGIVFMFAPLMHPAMRHVGPVTARAGDSDGDEHRWSAGESGLCGTTGRRRVGRATACRSSRARSRELGTMHALVVHGAPGLDEVSPLGADARHRDSGRRRCASGRSSPMRYGIRARRAEQLAGGSPKENAEMVLAVLGGEGSSGATAAVVLNAAAAIYVSGAVTTFDDAVAVAREAARSRLQGCAALERLRLALAR